MGLLAHRNELKNRARIGHGYLALSCIGCDGSVLRRGTLSGTPIQRPPGVPLRHDRESPSTPTVASITRKHVMHTRER